MASILVQLDGDTFPFEIPDDLEHIDTANPTAVAERNNLIRQELAEFKPETAEGEIEWTTGQEGKPLLKVTRATKTKGVVHARDERPTGAVHPVLAHLLDAPANVPLALGLALVLKYRQLAGTLDKATLLNCQESIQAVRATTHHDARYAHNVLAALERAHADPSPFPVPGF